MPTGSGTWQSMSTENAPSERSAHTAVWTGTEMIVWGGCPYATEDSNTGGKYDPEADTWQPIATTNVPSVRWGHTAVWTGTEMIVWGGFDNQNVYLNTGGKYDPVADTWQPISITNAPLARLDHTAVWTGTEMIIYGGRNAYSSDHPDGYLNTGGKYDPVADTWQPISTLNAPSARSDITAVWTGTEMIVWGGGTNTGSKYDPVTDSWQPISTLNAPSARWYHTAVWTGTEMIIWGGQEVGVQGRNLLNTGSKYDPVADTWQPITIECTPSKRRRHMAMWTGSEMIIWGGISFDQTKLSTGSRYDPSVNTWLATEYVGAPTFSYGTAIWTDSEMIVWGGSADGYLINSGSRYNPYE